MAWIGPAQTVATISRSVTTVAGGLMSLDSRLQDFMRKVAYYEKFFDRMQSKLPEGVHLCAQRVIAKCHEYNLKIRAELNSRAGYAVDAGRWVVGLDDWNVKMDRRLGQLIELVVLSNSLLAEFSLTGKVAPDGCEEELAGYLGTILVTVRLSSDIATPFPMGQSMTTSMYLKRTAVTSSDKSVSSNGSAGSSSDGLSMRSTFKKSTTTSDVELELPLRKISEDEEKYNPFANYDSDEDEAMASHFFPLSTFSQTVVRPNPTRSLARWPTSPTSTPVKDQSNGCTSVPASAPPKLQEPPAAAAAATTRYSAGDRTPKFKATLKATQSEGEGASERPRDASVPCAPPSAPFGFPYSANQFQQQTTELGHRPLASSPAAARMPAVDSFPSLMMPEMIMTQRLSDTSTVASDGELDDMLEDLEDSGFLEEGENASAAAGAERGTLGMRDQPLRPEMLGTINLKSQIVEQPLPPPPPPLAAHLDTLILDDPAVVAVAENGHVVVTTAPPTVFPRPSAATQLQPVAAQQQIEARATPQQSVSPLAAIRQSPGTSLQEAGDTGAHG